MPTFIKTGFWEKAVKGFKGWLDLDSWFESKKGYKSYVANLGATAANEIVPKYVFENTIGNVTFQTVNTGQYHIVLPEAVDFSKIYVTGIGDGWARYVGLAAINGNTIAGYLNFFTGVPNTSSNIIEMFTDLNQPYRTLFDSDPLNPTQFGTTGIYIEIRIYN